MRTRGRAKSSQGPARNHLTSSAYVGRSSTGWNSLTLTSIVIVVALPYLIFNMLAGVGGEVRNKVRDTTLRGSGGPPVSSVTVTEVVEQARVVLHSPSAPSKDVVGGGSGNVVSASAVDGANTDDAHSGDGSDNPEVEAVDAGAAGLDAAPAPDTDTGADHAGAAAVADNPHVFESMAWSFEVFRKSGPTDLVLAFCFDASPETLAVFLGSFRLHNSAAVVRVFLDEGGRPDDHQKRLEVMQHYNAKPRMVQGAGVAQWASADEYLRKYAPRIRAGIIADVKSVCFQRDPFKILAEQERMRSFYTATHPILQMSSVPQLGTEMMRTCIGPKLESMSNKA